MAAPTLDMVPYTQKLLLDLSKLIPGSKPRISPLGFRGSLWMGTIKKREVIEVIGTTYGKHPAIGNKKIKVTFKDKKYKSQMVLHLLQRERVFLQQHDIELIVE